jgi:hypothetical protein
MPSRDLSRVKEKMMKLTRVILACTLLLSASFPLFALPTCKACDVNNRCVGSPNSGDKCVFVDGVCDTAPTLCVSFAPDPVLADWTVSSIEVSCSDSDSNVVTTAAEVADTAEVSTTQSTEQK